MPFLYIVPNHIDGAILVDMEGFVLNLNNPTERKGEKLSVNDSIELVIEKEGESKYLPFESVHSISLPRYLLALEFRRKSIETNWHNNFLESSLKIRNRIHPSRELLQESIFGNFPHKEEQLELPYKFPKNTVTVKSYSDAVREVNSLYDN